MRSSDLDGLIAFRRVAETRSFTRAAADLGLTRSAVSQAVRALETRLGAPLLARSTRDVALNEAGATFLAEVAPALDRIGVAMDGVRQAGNRPAGLLRLNVPQLAVAPILAPRLPRFLAAYPLVEVEIFTDDRLASIIEGGFDAGIRLGESLQQDMVSVRLTGPDRLVVVGSPSYLAARGRPKHPRDLGAQDCINFRQASRGSLYRWEFAVDGEEIEVAVTGRITVNDSATKLRAAIDGLGLAYELESVVRADIEAGRLELVLDAFAVRTSGFFLYFPARAQVLPKLRAFIEFLRR